MRFSSFSRISITFSPNFNELYIAFIKILVFVLKKQCDIKRLISDYVKLKILNIYTETKSNRHPHVWWENI